VLDAFAIQAQTLNAIFSQRVVKPHALYESAVTTVARISYNYTVKRALLSATTS
jgi:hypothetical protein